MSTVLLVLTSHAPLGDTGRTTGFFVGEAAHPWKELTDAGHTVDLASVQGGRPPMDGLDSTDPVQQAFLEDERMAGQLSDTRRVEDVDATAYDAVLYVGGHGTMWDFPGNAAVAGIARDVYEGGGAVAAVCHGPAGLVDVTLSDGTYLVDGKDVAGFTNAEEEAVGLSEVVPFALETRLVERGARHSGGENFEPHVVVDGRLVTGQNPASATGVGQALVRVLAERAAA